MNRQWAAFFGRGLVRTAEDFGYQGEPPSHPELLDWLALELARQGWSMKRMHKLIVTSATYQQSSRATPELLAKDPENRLLARGPRVRLEAEVIRDAALRASGLLCERVGGPSVFPPQPAGVTTEGTYGGLTWKVSPGGDRYRRGLYTFTKRTAPFAMVDDLRRAQRRGLRRPARGFQHAAAGPDALERPGVRGGRAGAGPVDGRARRARRGAGRCPLPPLPHPAAGSGRAVAARAFFRIAETAVRAQGARRRQDRRPRRRARPANARPGPSWPGRS